MLTSAMQRVIGLRSNARQLAIARIVIGIDAVFASFEALRMLSRVLTPMIVKVPFLPWLPVLPSGALRIFIAVWIVAALLFALGWKTRVAGAVLVLTTGYALIVDQQTYSNHLYFLVLVILLLTISDSGAAWSLDARRHGARSEVAAWPIFLLKFQVTIVYLFSALAKITPEYLGGEILTRSLKQAGWLAVPLAWRGPMAMSAMAVASIAAELFIAFGLWSPRLRRYAIFVGVAFHLLILTTVDSSRLSLAIFALEMFAVYALFVDGEFWNRSDA